MAYLGVSPYGVLDMQGNSTEWVEDYYHPSFDGAPTDGSAWLLPVTQFRASRTGPEDRNFGEPDEDPDCENGFRCCQSVPDVGAPGVQP
jgi:formylglycine-generating enzyme required for sulfatase activity